MRAKLGWRVATALLMAGCGGPDGGVQTSHAGNLVVTFFQGGAQSGAILLTISGGAVESVAPIAGVPVPHCLEDCSRGAGRGETSVIEFYSQAETHP